MEATQTDETTNTHDSEGPTFLEEGPNLPRILTPNFVEEFEKGIAVYKRWVAACYRLTRESHWINHGTANAPKFSLQGPGAEALMNPLGISFEAPNTRKEPLEQSGYAYWVEGYMESRTLRRRGYYLGYCDSRDPFFNARSGWKPETGHGDIRKAATTNWIVNAVTRLAGLRDPDPKLLADAGLDMSRIQTIDYRGGKTPEESTGAISEPQRKRLWAIAKSAGISEDALRPYLKDFFKVDSMKEIRRGDYEAICKQVETGKLPAVDGTPQNSDSPVESKPDKLKAAMDWVAAAPDADILSPVEYRRWNDELHVKTGSQADSIAFLKAHEARKQNILESLKRDSGKPGEEE